MNTTPTPAQADEKARVAVERLANVQMNLSLEEWSQLSSNILAALRPEVEPVARVTIEETGPVCKYFTEIDGRLASLGLGTHDLFASPPAPAVKVRALHWENELGDRFYYADWLAGEYIAIQERDGTATLRTAGRCIDTTRVKYASLDEAKAAAQADYEARILSALLPPSKEAQAAAPAEALPSQTSWAEIGAGMAEMAEIARIVSEWRHGPMLSPDALRRIAALAKPASEPAGGGVLRDENNPKVILDGIAEALESAGYVHMANKEGVASILAELVALSSPASSSPAEAEALPAGVDAAQYVSVGWQHRLQIKPDPKSSWAISDEWTEWREGNHRFSKKMAAGFNIEEREIFALSPAPAQAGSAGETGNG